MRAVTAWAVVAMACGHTQVKAPTPRTIALPGVGPTGVILAELLFDPRTNSVWAPAGDGVVYVIDGKSGAVRTISGFASQQLSHGANKRIVGPSSVTLGPPGTVYVGDRGDFSVCAIDEATLAKRACTKLDAMPDAIAYFADGRELWVTSPVDRSIRLLDGTTLVEKSRLELDGTPEGLVFDTTRGRVYTNLADKDLSIAIEPMAHKRIARWHPGCGTDGPRGLRLADAEGILLVACSAKIKTLDIAHDGKVLGSLATDPDIDLDYVPTTKRVYLTSPVGTLTIARLERDGKLNAIAKVTTAEHARKGVVATDGRVYLAREARGEIVVITPP
jgi:hypothetical protein